MNRLLVSLVLAAALLAPASALAARQYHAHLSGRNEIPPLDTNAQGEVLLQVERDGSAIRYRLIVSNMEDVTMAHIHWGLPTQVGGLVAWLYPVPPSAPPATGRMNGVLVEGTITAANLTGALTGMALSDLIARIDAGEAYVNVHTAAHPVGEVRGQLEPVK